MTRDEPKPSRRRDRPTLDARRRASRAARDDRSTEAVELRALLDAIPDLEEDPIEGGSPEARMAAGAKKRPAPAKAAAPAEEATPVRRGPARLGRTARIRQLAAEAPAASRREQVWQPAASPRSATVTDDRPTAAPATIVPDVDEPETDEATNRDSDTDVRVPAIEPASLTDRTRAPVERPWYRRVAFATVLLVLLASIPVLGREGYRLVTRSRAGHDASLDLDRTDPNYVEQVQSTPTALIAQTDAEGDLLGLTVLALSNETGGTVMFLPIDAQLRESRYFFDTISGFFGSQRRRLNSLASTVPEVLGVGIDRVEGFDDSAFVHWLAPVGSLTFTNPDSVLLPDGTFVEPGEIALEPAQVGPYLAFVAEGEDQFSQYLRHQLVWEAWLEAVAEDPDARVPAAETDPLAPFIRHLATGTTRIETIAGEYDEEGRFIIDSAVFDTLILDAVPAPASPAPGVRHRVRILNGVAPEAPPPSIVRTLVALDAEVVIVGNGPSFDRTETEIIYAEPEDRTVAEEMLAALGATNGTVRESATQADEADLTVVLGRDVLQPSD